MPAAPLPSDEKQRLESLHSYQILDTLPEQEYDDVVRIASQVCGSAIALVSLVDVDRQWFKAKVGVDVDQTPRDWAFCAHAILKPGEILHVSDATQDVRFADNPLVLSDPRIRLYAGSPLISSDGQPLGTLCVIDNYPRELSEDQLQSLAALSRQLVSLLELRREKQNLELAKAELLRSNQELSEFAQIVSHDLKEPLRGLSALAGILLQEYRERLDDQGRDLLSKLDESSRRMNIRVDTLLEYAQVGRRSVKRKPVDMNEVMDAVAGYLSELIREHQAEIRWHNLPTVQGDRALLEQALQNLVINAIKYNHSSPKRIVVGTQVVADSHSESPAPVFFVSDNGIGIDKKYHHSVFGMFRRLHLAEEYGGGSGAGLAITKKIIESHGGKIWIDPDFSSGTCFWFYLNPEAKIAPAPHYMNSI